LSVQKCGGRTSAPTLPQVREAMDHE
jgi:hypothetical protein